MAARWRSLARLPGFPSDARRSGRREPRQLIAGRVVACSEGSLVLADASAQITVRFRSSLKRLSSLTPGDWAVVDGTLRAGRFEATRLVSVAPAPEPRAPGEHARLTWQGVGKALELRARILASVRAYFASEGFIEVETPARVRTPGLDQHIDALRADRDWLVTTPELHLKRLLVGGLPRVYSLGKCFRAEEHGPLHQPEFVMLEWYRAFAKLEHVMADTEALVRLALQTTGFGDEVRVGERTIDLSRPFLRLSVETAFRRFAKVKSATRLAAREPARFFELLTADVQAGLEAQARPVFLCDFPLALAALAQASSTRPQVAERFELYLAGIELCNGYGELTDPGEHRRRFEAEQERRRRVKAPVYAIDEAFMSALEEGMPPAAGNALGVDRLVMIAIGATTLEDVIAFPDSWR